MYHLQFIYRGIEVGGMLDHLTDLTRILSKYQIHILLLLLVLFLLLCGLVFLLVYQKGKPMVPVTVDQVTTLGPEMPSATPHQVTVDLSGGVLHPGIYTLVEGSRIGDLLDMSGGISADAAKTWIDHQLNLAEPLKDSQKVYVPFEWEVYESTQSVPAGIDPCTDTLIDDLIPKLDPIQYALPSITGTLTESEGKLNVNKASATELDALPGIGPAYASKIFSSRPYADLADLKERSGVPGATLDKIADKLVFSK